MRKSKNKLWRCVSNFQYTLAIVDPRERGEGWVLGWYGPIPFLRQSMYCPFCNVADTKVIDSRLSHEGQQVRRRRLCLQCNVRFSSFESAELSLPRVIKRDSTRSAFNQEKLRAGMLKALEKRPITSEQVEAVILRLIKRLRSSGEREISSRQLGEWVMEELSALDPVAYVRFASVYRSFQDVQAFNQTIEQLKRDLSSNKKPSYDIETDKK